MDARLQAKVKNAADEALKILRRTENARSGKKGQSLMSTVYIRSSSRNKQAKASNRRQGEMASKLI